jgi:hypothetical protein
MRNSIISLIWTLILVAPASAQLAPVKIPNTMHSYQLSPAAMTIATGQACQLLYDGNSVIYTKREIADRLMDSEGLSRRNANHVANILVKKSANCKSAAMTIGAN